MNPNTPCQTDNLPLLLRDELSIPETKELEHHLSTCPDCRCELEKLAAEESWWEEASSHLSAVTASHGAEIDWLETGDSVVAELTTAPAGRVSRADAAVLDSPRHPEMLGRIGQYDIEAKIGQGGMGIVFRAFDTALNRTVAIKVLAPHLASSGIARKRFTREARAAAAVRHPNVIPIYNVNASDERPYIVMELVDGTSLQEHIQNNGPLEPVEIVRIANQIAAGLVEAHEQGLVHRDIKPANILIEKDVSRVMITDFGLARAADDVAMTQTGWLAGTPHYMSPEQARGMDIDHRSDLFSLGSVIYFMATGREPFRAEKPLAVLEKINSTEPIGARSINNRIPATLDRIIGNLLEKNVEQRSESARTIQKTLASYLAHLQHPQSNPKPSIPRSSAGRSGWLRPLALAACAVLMLSLAVIYAASVWAPVEPDAGISAPATSGDTAEPGSPIEQSPTIAPDNSENRFSWMKDLQSYDVWINEANELERDIQNLELEFSGFEGSERLPEIESTDSVPLQENHPEPNH
ncbi:MAG: protein kinase [Planctomycetota bacterium]